MKQGLKSRFAKILDASGLQCRYIAGRLVLSMPADTGNRKGEPMKAVEAAQAVLDAAKRNQFSVSVRSNGILTITRHFQAGSREALVDCDMTYGSVLGAMPRTSAGSDWGTDCGGIGALSALKSGVFTMHRSGCSKRVIAALAKMI